MRLSSLRYGSTGKSDLSVKKTKKLDVLADELMVNMLSSSYHTCLLVSEKSKDVIEVLHGLPT